jgi:glucose uptake protein GlcU
MSLTEVESTPVPGEPSDEEAVQETTLTLRRGLATVVYRTGYRAGYSAAMKRYSSPGWPAFLMARMGMMVIRSLIGASVEKVYLQ